MTDVDEPFVALVRSLTGPPREQIMYDPAQRAPSEAINGPSFNSPRMAGNRGGGDWPPKNQAAQRPEELSLPQDKPERRSMPLDMRYANGHQHAGGGGGVGEKAHTSRTHDSHMSHASDVNVVGWGPRTRIVQEQNAHQPDTLGGRFISHNVFIIWFL